MTDRLIERIIASLGTPSKVIPDSLVVEYWDGTELVVPYLDQDAAAAFLRLEEGVVDAYTMYPGLKWKD